MEILAARNTEGIELDFTSNVVMNDNMLREKVSLINTLSDKEVYEFVKQYYTEIMNIIFESNDKNEKRFFVDLFMNTKFILALTQAMYTEQPSETTKKRLNKMCYDYLVISEHDAKDYTSGLLMSLAKTINRDKIPQLCAIPLPEDLASVLALSRYSSEKEIVNVKRLNRTLMMQPVDSITEQMVVDTYLTLFDHVLPLFTGVMLDVESPSNMTPSTMEIYGIITLAILDILNELPIADIKTALKLFDSDRQIMYSDKPIRINLESITETDYPRILKAIDQLRSEGIHLYLR